MSGFVLVLLIKLGIYVTIVGDKIIEFERIYYRWNFGIFMTKIKSQLEEP